MGSLTFHGIWQNTTYQLQYSWFKAIVNGHALCQQWASIISLNRTSNFRIRPFCCFNSVFIINNIYSISILRRFQYGRKVTIHEIITSHDMHEHHSCCLTGYDFNWSCVTLSLSYQYCHTWTAWIWTQVARVWIKRSHNWPYDITYLLKVSGIIHLWPLDYTKRYSVLE